MAAQAPVQALVIGAQPPCGSRKGGSWCGARQAERVDSKARGVSTQDVSSIEMVFSTMLYICAHSVYCMSIKQKSNSPIYANLEGSHASRYMTRITSMRASACSDIGRTFPRIQALTANTKHVANLGDTIERTHNISTTDSKNI